MKVSIITVVRNSRETIADAVQSVLSQTYSDIEYVVIDGDSGDGTLDVLEKVEDALTVLISEPDAGIYDALNKGIRLSGGDVVGVLHADDRFASSNVIADVVDLFAQEQMVDVVYGDLNYVDRQNPDQIRRRWVAGEATAESFRYGWMPPHPTVFARREVFDRCGMYDTSFGTAADYEFLLRVFVKHAISARYLPRTITEMRSGGASGRSLAGRLAANRHDYEAWLANDLRPAWFTRYAKPARKIGQYLSAMKRR